MMTPWGGSEYRKNSERGGNVSPCAYCGKKIKDPEKAIMLGVAGGGSRFYNPKDYEAEYKKNPAGEMGNHPLGPDCAKRLKAEQPELFV